jgi:hypothetical protein
VEAVLLPPLLPVPADVLEQPAAIAASMKRAASGRSVLLMVFSPFVLAGLVAVDLGWAVLGAVNDR